MKRLRILMSAAALLFGGMLRADFALEAGPYRIVYSEKDRFCMSRMFYQGYEIGGDRGYYGTILANGKNKFVGSGHTEGGPEKVLSTEILLDGQVYPRRTGIISGEKVVFRKVCMLDHLKLNVTFTLTPEQVRIDKQWTVEADQNIFSFYVYQFCWSSDTDQWMMLRPKGEGRSGFFKSDNSWVREWGEVNLFALYSSRAKKGIAGYFPNYFKGQGSYWLWDKSVYHKFYFPASLPPRQAAGVKSPVYSLILRGFQAEPAVWQKTVTDMDQTLKKEYPLSLYPENIRLDFGSPDGLVLKGNKKFLCRKFKVDLAEKADYTIEFKILKEAGLSKSSTDNMVLLGQYDENRKFHWIKSWATRLPMDGAWHQVRETFRTPEKLHDCAVFIYNSKTDKLLKVKDMTLRRQTAQ